MTVVIIFTIHQVYQNLILCGHMEKIPGLRIVGDASEEIKGAAKIVIESRLTNHVHSLSEKDREYIVQHEYPKTEQELVLIDFANSETNRLREEVGLEPYDIPAENYRLIPEKVYKEIGGTGIFDAVTFFIKQGILFNAELFRDNPVFFGSVALHESLHLKGHFTVEAEEIGGKISITPYREGITARAAQKKKSQGENHSHLIGLHEAIVAEQQKHSMQNLLALPVLKKEMERLSSEDVRALSEKISKKIGIPKEDLIWVGENENEYKSIPYRSQRKVLRYTCEEIEKQFPEKYQSADEVFKEFLKAQFTGRLLPVARLVENTFGKGSFRRLGDMEINQEGGILTLEAMKKLRTGNKKKLLQIFGSFGGTD